MLVLSRKVGEKIRIGRDITVVVLQVRGHQVNIGIDAPDHVDILRKELEDPLAGPSIIGNRRCKVTQQVVGNPLTGRGNRPC